MPTGGMSSSRLKVQSLSAVVAPVTTISNTPLDLRPSNTQGILQQLQSDDEALQLDGLNQLNELLAVSMEDSLSIFPVESLVPVLVSPRTSTQAPPGPACPQRLACPGELMLMQLHCAGPAAAVRSQPRHHAAGSAGTDLPRGCAPSILFIHCASWGCPRFLRAPAQH